MRKSGGKVKIWIIPRIKERVDWLLVRAHGAGFSAASTASGPRH